MTLNIYNQLYNIMLIMNYILKHYQINANNKIAKITNISTILQYNYN